MSAPAAAAPTAAPGRARPALALPLLPWRAARLLGFAGLAAFGAAHWALMVEPAATGPLLGAVVVALAGGVAMGACRRAAGLAAHGLGVGVVAAMALVAALVSGLPAALVVPGGWGELAAGLSQGLEALPDVRVPYAGVDVWPRHAIVLGGGLLIVAAAAAALWPARRRPGLGQGAAVVALGALYAVPAVDVTMDRPLLRGAAFAVLLAAFLWLERVPRTGAAPAAAALALAIGAGLAVAPSLDRAEPLIDYEALAESLAPTAGVGFDFSHSYGPIDWPRDGRELLRVRTAEPTYWKAENLDEFDGRRWIVASEGSLRARTPLSSELPPPQARRREWIRRIRVSVRSLRGHEAVAAGATLALLRPPSAAVATPSPGTFLFEDPLERGDSYAADVYVPRPSPREMAATGADYTGLARHYLELTVPARGGPTTVTFPPFGSEEVPVGTEEVPAEAAAASFAAPLGPEQLAGTRYARAYALARRLAADTATPYEYVQRVLGHLSRGFAYTEDAPRRRDPIDAFLFRDRTGHCQHFSGAMALLLRMGGVPARVVGGFSPGSYSRRRRDYVVRDVDAHSWVEAWFPGYGWVTFDPTPAAAPARSQLLPIEVGSAAAGGDPGGLARRGDRPEPGPRAAPTPQAGPAGAGDGGGGAGRELALAALTLLALGGIAAGAIAVRRRKDGEPDAPPRELAELHRALRRCGQPAPRGATLAALERRFDADPGARAYVRALRERRYGWGSRPPDPRQRRELRRALARGRGASGRLRALWALPPLPTRRRRPLH